MSGIPDYLPDEQLDSYVVFKSMSAIGKLKLEELAQVEASGPVQAILIVAEEVPSRSPDTDYVAVRAEVVNNPQRVKLRCIASLA